MSTIFKNIACLCSAIIFSTAFAEPDNAIQTLKGNALKTYLTNYAINHLTHQDDETIEVELLQLDQSTILPPCSKAIDISIPKKSYSERTASIALSCKAQTSWNIYFPMNIKLITNVLVANRAIQSGEIISENDIVYEQQDKNRLLEGFYKENSSIIGLAAARPINAGAIFTPRNTRRMPIIKKNQTVNLTIKTGNIEIQMIGIAKSDGYLNGPIKILNSSSKKIIDAIVKDTDKAELNY